MIRQQHLTATALEAVNQQANVEDAKTLCHNACAWLSQNGLAAGIDAIIRYQHKDISAWLINSYQEVLLRLGYQRSRDFRAWALSLDSLSNLRVNEILIEYTHMLTRLVRLRKDNVL